MAKGWLTARDATACAEVAARYPLKITPYYMDLAVWGDPTDPILAQCLPDARELNDGLDADPFEEEGSTGIAGLVQRYPDRALLVTTRDCAVRCRHCTRKNLLGDDRNVLEAKDWDAVCRALEQRQSVREVILSGGDPLLLATAELDRMLADLHARSHVETVRLGTRVPVVLPMRIDDELADVLARHRPLWVNTQFNHPVELTPESLGACERLVSRGIPVSNQTVLLRGINDDVDTLAALCNGLQRSMVRPYYVFQCDPVGGTGHFHTDLQAGLALERALRKRLGGLAMPRFVADVPKTGAKVPLVELGCKGGEA